MRPKFGCSFTTECEEATNGIKVDLTFSTSMELVFDHVYVVAKHPRTLNDAINLAKVSMLLHNFTTCDIVDGITGEVLAILTQEQEEN